MKPGRAVRRASTRPFIRKTLHERVPPEGDFAPQNLALGAGIGYRCVIAEKDKRLLRQSFALYLAPEVIDKLMALRRPPALGGEMRNVTELFSDVAADLHWRRR